MSTFPGSPKLLKGGLIVLAPDGTRARRVISLQYNPDTPTRSYRVQGIAGVSGGDRAAISIPIIGSDTQRAVFHEERFGVAKFRLEVWTGPGASSIER